MINENNDIRPEADKIFKEEHKSELTSDNQKHTLSLKQEERAHIDACFPNSPNKHPSQQESEESLLPTFSHQERIYQPEMPAITLNIPSQPAEEKSSIFNSKFIMTKNELESFYEQNSVHHLTNNNYDDNMRLQDEMNSLMNDERMDFPFKTPPKTSQPNDRNSSEKPIKRKKNMNNLRKELDDELTHSIFEKPKIEMKPIEDSPKKEESPCKYPYKPLNPDKEKHYENYLEQY